jgi:hypothetical protein
MNINDNYKHKISINQWALLEYFKAKKFSLVVQRDILKKITGTHYILLSQLIYFCSVKKLNKKEFNGVVYTQIDDKLILDNLPLYTDYLADKSTRVNKLKKWVKRLEDYGFIKRQTYNKVSRYVAIDNVLLEKLKPLPPLQHLQLYHKKELLKIKKEYASRLLYNRYDKVFNSFFNNEDYKYCENVLKNRDTTIDSQGLINRLKLYLDKEIETPLYQNKNI